MAGRRTRSSSGINAYLNSDRDEPLLLISVIVQCCDIDIIVVKSIVTEVGVSSYVLTLIQAMSAKNLHSLNWLQQQFRLNPGKPDYISGIRTLLILSVPIAVGFFLGQPKLSAIPTISAFFIGTIAVNGTYRQQAVAISAASVGVTLSLLIANLVSGNFWLAILTTFIFIFLLGLASLFGAVMARVSLVTSLMFIISLAKFSSFPDLATVLEQALLCMAGGLWVIVLSWILSIARPYTPAVQAVADCYLALSRLTQLAKDSVSYGQQREDWTRQFLQAQDVAIANLTSARDIWTSAWTTGKSGSPRSRQLLVLIEDANQIIHALVALEELIAIASQNPLFEHLQKEIEQTIEQMALGFQKLSRVLKKKQTSVPLEDLDRSLEALEHQWQSFRSQTHAQKLKIQSNDYVELVSLGKIVTSLGRLSEQIHTDVEAAIDPGLQFRRQKFFLTQPEPAFWFDTIKNNLTFDSVTFRHALRLALVITIAQLLSYLLPIPTGYWITLTALIALKPNFGGTVQSAGQRILGTLVGSVVGIIFVTLIHNSLALTLLIFLLLFGASSMLPLSYSLFISLITPAIILLLSFMGMGDWEVGIQRIVDVLIGGTLALVGSYLLFPSWERHQLPRQLEKTVRANLAYFQIAIDRCLDGEDKTAESLLNRLRHRASLENANAEASAQRLFSEPRHIRGEIEPVMTLLLYIRSLFSSTTTLVEHSSEFSGEIQFAQIRQLTEAIEQVLNNLASTIARRQKLQPLPPLEDYLAVICDRIFQLHTARISEIASHLVKTTPTLLSVRQQTPIATQLSRIVRGVTIMHQTIDRSASFRIRKG